MPDICWQDLIEAENGETRGRLAGELLRQGITANVRTLVRIHKWLLSCCVTPEGTLSREDGFASICLLVTIGFKDTQTGHSYMKSLVDSPSCQQVDADAMEAMAFEKKQWDGLYILKNCRILTVKRSRGPASMLYSTKMSTLSFLHSIAILFYLALSMKTLGKEFLQLMSFGRVQKQEGPWKSCGLMKKTIG